MKKLVFILAVNAWVSLGFAQNIELVEDINPGLSNSLPYSFTVANGLLFFVTDNGALGQELGVMNASEQVTVMDITPGAEGTDPTDLIGTDTHLFFLTSNYDQNDDFESHSLWSSDGTLNGTQMLGTFPDPVLSTGITGMRTTSSLLFFVAAYEDQPLRELWRSDGTPEGTFMIDVNNDLVPSIVYDDFNPETNEDELFFNSAIQHAIYRSDGTPEGTVAIVSNTVDPLPGKKILAHQDGLYYIPSNRGLRRKPINGGDELIIIEGGEEAEVEDLLQVVDGKLYFMARDVTHGTELWVYDPFSKAKGAVHLVKDFNLGNGSSSILSPVNYQEKLYFGASYQGYNGQIGVLPQGQELWITRGSTLSTKLFKDVNPGTESGLNSFQPQVYANRLFFAADDGVHGMELWVTDGYPGLKVYTDADLNGGTYMVEDFQTGLSGSNPSGLTVYNGTLYFSADDGVLGRELYKFQIPKSIPVKATAQPSPIKAYPNPTQGVFTLEWEEGTAIRGQGLLTITSHHGKVVRKEKVSLPFTRQINLAHQEPGIYLVKIAIDDQQFTKKVVVN